MKELTMFDISNPLDDEQMMEIEGGAGYCGCDCKGDDQINYPGWSGFAANRSANDATDSFSCDCWDFGPAAAAWSLTL